MCIGTCIYDLSLPLSIICTYESYVLLCIIYIYIYICRGPGGQRGREGGRAEGEEAPRGRDSGRY